MKVMVVLVGTFIFLHCAAAANAFSYTCTRSWYVATTGSDSSDGRTARTPFKTINRATFEPMLHAGDCIQVAPGDYPYAVFMEKGGTINHPDGFVALVSSGGPGRAVIHQTRQYSTLWLKANYLIVDGFEIYGRNGGSCVETNYIMNHERNLTPHHIVVQNSIIHDCDAAGIALGNSEWYWIERNRVHDTATCNGAQFSGIDVYEARDSRVRSGRDVDQHFRISILNNVVHDNFEGSCIGGEHTDGNGIIIDDFHNGQDAGLRGEDGRPVNYAGATLVQGNLVYGNGGKGIQVYVSDHVVVRNNTVYHNNTDDQNPATYKAEINIQQSSDIRFVNNIAVADARHGPRDIIKTCLADGSYPGHGEPDRHNYFLNNLTFNGTAGDACAYVLGDSRVTISRLCNRLGVAPRFRDPPADFTLAPASPARSAGTLNGGAPVDILGHAWGRQLDIGAFAHTD